MINVAVLHEKAGGAVGDHVRRAAVGAANHRFTVRHGFQKDETESLSAAGQREDVAGVVGRLPTGLEAGSSRKWTFDLRVIPVREGAAGGARRCRYRWRPDEGREQLSRSSRQGLNEMVDALVRFASVPTSNGEDHAAVGNPSRKRAVRSSAGELPNSGPRLHASRQIFSWGTPCCDVNCRAVSALGAKTRSARCKLLRRISGRGVHTSMPCAKIASACGRRDQLHGGDDGRQVRVKRENQTRLPARRLPGGLQKARLRAIESGEGDLPRSNAKWRCIRRIIQTEEEPRFAAAICERGKGRGRQATGSLYSAGRGQLRKQSRRSSGSVRSRRIARTVRSSGAAFCSHVRPALFPRLPVPRRTAQRPGLSRNWEIHSASVCGVGGIFHDETVFAVNDDFGAAIVARSDDRQTAGHRFRRGLREGVFQ